MSIHTDAAFLVAQSKGAAAGRDRSDWEILVKFSKRELIEALLHLAALCSESEGYDDALENGGAAKRAIEEIEILRRNGLV